jgi:hypothetical protein
MEKYYIIRRTDDGIKFEEAYGKKLENDFGLELYIEHCKNGHWKITEGTSGLLMYQGKTRKETISECFEKLNNIDMGNIKMMIKSCINKHGISPLYAMAEC